jgi:hypothetical protein
MGSRTSTGGFEAPSGQAKYPPVLSGEYRDLKYRQTRLMETATTTTTA